MCVCETERERVCVCVCVCVCRKKHTLCITGDAIHKAEGLLTALMDVAFSLSDLETFFCSYFSDGTMLQRELADYHVIMHTHNICTHILVLCTPLTEPPVQL